MYMSAHNKTVHHPVHEWLYVYGEVLYAQYMSTNNKTVNYTVNQTVYQWLYMYMSARII